MLATEPGNHFGAVDSGSFWGSCSSVTAACFSFLLLLRSDSNLNGVDTRRMPHLGRKAFHITIDRNRSTKDVIIPFPRIFHELATLRSPAWDGASSKTCSAYLANRLSRAP